MIVARVSNGFKRFSRILLPRLEGPVTSARPVSLPSGPAGVDSKHCVHRTPLDDRGCEDVAPGDERQRPERSVPVSVSEDEECRREDEPVESADVSSMSEYKTNEYVIVESLTGLGPVCLADFAVQIVLVGRDAASNSRT
ncbi:hypothetical protein C488_19015 [Natrinema pellirubrum DSM 15624]|uniref:Uncharacterized protein n=1 Tax=Natrinema pellirubrum (strain DSM 15624 / CIP 106293 / JCM 10476 / NCIMB 786 / 157) TaxID=797303 RepID=L9Y8Z9_NATP1|nr:hypothetical protein C488_19015 [Natrinema pellirubrum DSM 15624]